MSHNINGPLHTVSVGPTGAIPMVFIHPNPMDSSSWLFQMAHFSSWYRCVAIDLPGYGRSPSAGPELRMQDIAAACWEAVDADIPGETGPCVLVGCSVGATVVQHMYHLRPEATGLIVVSGTGWHEVKKFAQRHIANYRRDGLAYRWEYTLYDFSAEFRESDLAEWFARLFTERNDTADLDTIIRMFLAQEVPDPPWLQGNLAAPVLILTGSEDNAHDAAFALRDRLPSAELVTIEGAGHACHIEQPWVFDREVLRFMNTHRELLTPN
jgi:pimeloyl-ACP methyl ester carboxylesterase